LLQAQPDDRLLALARNGHEPAFEALVRRYRRQLLAYCRKLAAPEASAEDMLQQALMQAWRALVSGAEVHDARAWLYRIVHNAVVSATRKGGQDPAELSNEISGVEVEQVVEQRLAAREALAGLAALPALQREVMLGTAVEGRSHEEVAASLGITSGSVRGLLYRARSTLRAAAAALIPPPMIEWAIRQQQAGRTGASGMVEAIAGGGSAGVAGAMLKGGAVVTVAGALAGTAAVVVTHRFHIRPAPAQATVTHRAAPNRRIVALVGTPDIAVASTREPGVAGKSASAPSARLEPVTSSTRHHAGRPAGSDRAGESHSGTGQTRSNGGDRSRPPDRQETGSPPSSGSSTGGADHSGDGSYWSSSGGQATAASASQFEATNSPRDASSTQGGAIWGGATSTSQPNFSPAAAESQTTSTTPTQSPQPAPSPSGTGSSVTGSE
jgi:RNA polymerase sigma factor (sigma-70 family)